MPAHKQGADDELSRCADDFSRILPACARYALRQERFHARLAGWNTLIAHAATRETLLTSGERGEIKHWLRIACAPPHIAV